MKNSGVMSVLVILVLLVMSLGALAQDAAAPSVQLAFGTDIDRESRELVGETAVFSAGIERITCLTRLVGLEAPTSVTHVWYRDGKTMARVDLNVASSNWRTWSSKRLLPDWTGHWEVKVLDSDGQVLGSAGFDVQ